MHSGSRYIMRDSLTEIGRQPNRLCSCSVSHWQWNSKRECCLILISPTPQFWYRPQVAFVRLELQKPKNSSQITPKADWCTWKLWPTISFCVFCIIWPGLISCNQTNSACTSKPLSSRLSSPKFAIFHKKFELMASLKCKVAFSHRKSTLV